MIKQVVTRGNFRVIDLNDDGDRAFLSYSTIIGAFINGVLYSSSTFISVTTSKHAGRIFYYCLSVDRDDILWLQLNDFYDLIGLFGIKSKLRGSGYYVR